MLDLIADDTEVQQLRRQVDEAERELDAFRQKMRQQLELAAKVHHSLLPRPVCDHRIHVDVRYIPIEQVGGDYCQVRFPDRDTCFLTTSDVTGHGIGPALLSARVSSEVRYGILYGRSPRAIVQALNTFICDHFDQADLYLSFVGVQIDLADRRVTWCGAGHPSPLLVRRDGAAVEFLSSQNPLIGITKDFLADEPENTLPIEPGDRLVLYTDGLTETADAAGRQLGTAGLVEIVQQAMSVELFEMADCILDQVTRHNHGPVLDDKTLIVAELR